jgi:hypothetical protein
LSEAKAYYPTPTVATGRCEKYEFGDLFGFEQFAWGNEPTPLACLSYNSQRSAFVIVDGQHRAMAVLALHRQLTQSWHGNVYQSYYDHIKVTPDRIMRIELPVCILFFPDLHEGSSFPARGIDLRAVCREVFLVVNRSAKPVSQTRELLLDDEDFAARLMRQTLSKIKARRTGDYRVGRIYSIAYGDSEADEGRYVVRGRLEYSSAVALHKLHAALAFGREAAFGWSERVDVSDGRNARNPSRPAEILLGTAVEHHSSLSRRQAKTLTPADQGEVVEKLGALTDAAILSLFDEFRPFTVHNSEMQKLRDKLSDPNFLSDNVQKKCRTLIFEGSGIRDVFDSHVDRLRGMRQEAQELGDPVPDYVTSQLDYCESVLRALERHERDLQRRKAAAFFQIDHDAFFAETADEEGQQEQKRLQDRANRLFQTVANQAFQFGYCMALFSAMEELRRANCTGADILRYAQRQELTAFLSRLFLAALNAYFSPQETALHKTLTGYVSTPRAGVFDATALGLRGLLAMHVNELNERQWFFFRYGVLELVHSRLGWEAARGVLAQAETDWKAVWYRNALPSLVEAVFTDRERFWEQAVNARLNEQDFQRSLDRARFEAKGAQKSEAEIEAMLAKLREDKRKESQETVREHLKASLGVVEGKDAMLARLTAPS